MGTEFFSRGKVTSAWWWPPASSAKVKNEWSYTSTPCICLQGIDRDNFMYIRVEKGGSLPLDPALHANIYILMLMTSVYFFNFVTQLTRLLSFVTYLILFSKLSVFFNNFS
jgi:hypothetical protein